MGRVLAWRPIARASALDRHVDQPPTIWSMVKGSKEIDCLIDRTDVGCTICWMVNRQWLFRSVFARYSEAAAAAQLKYNDLSASGWTPAGGSRFT